MQKNIYNEQTGISYTLQGNYYLPDLGTCAISNSTAGYFTPICSQAAG